MTKNSFLQKLNEYTTTNNKKRIEAEITNYSSRFTILTQRRQNFTRIKSLEKTNTFSAKNYKIIKLFKGEAYLGNKRVVNNENVIIEGNVQDIYADEQLVIVMRNGCILYGNEYLNTNEFVQLSDYFFGLNALIFTNEKDEINFYDLKSLKPVFKSKIETNILKIHEDGNLLLTGTDTMDLTDLRSTKTIYSFDFRADSAIFTNGHFVCAATENLLRCFDLRNFSCVGTVMGNQSMVNKLRNCKDDMVISVCGSNVCVSVPYLNLILKNNFFGGVDADWDGEIFVVLDDKSFYVYK